jgi:isoquinoline 1-oxidoreductase subunit beta
VIALNRSDFVRLTASAVGGLVLGFGADGCSKPSETSGAAFQPNQWLVVRGDGRVTLFVNKSEMGQGVATGLPTILAEELDVPLSIVEVEFAPAGPQYIDPGMKMQITGGSTSVRDMWMPLRTAGATARAMLVAAAAKQWNVDPATLQTREGAVVDPSSKRSATYASLAQGASAQPIPANVRLKDPKNFVLVGKVNQRLDTPLKVNGSATYGIDVRVPGMRYATVVHPPCFGAKIRSFNPAKAKTVTGVVDVVKLPDDAGIAVVAENTWSAFQGAQALVVEYDNGPMGSVSTPDLFARYRALVNDPAKAIVAAQRGAGVAPGTNPIEATYEGPLVAHAAMEPMNATASVTSSGVEVWAPTQVQTAARASAAQIAGMPLERVAVHTTYLGGGFGRRLYHDYTDEAVAVSKAIGAPVHLVWPREEDIQHDFYRPMAVNKIRGAFDASGNLVALEHTVVMDSIEVPLGFHLPPSGLDQISTDVVDNMPYSVPWYRAYYVDPQSGVPAGSLRAPGANWNNFVVETFLDELAYAAHKDAAAFRIALLAHDPRAVNVIETVRRRAGTPAPGTKHGLAYGPWNGTRAATIAEVSMTGRTPRVHRVWAVVDCGLQINPTIVAQQIQGATQYGLSMALASKITLKNGAVEQHNFYDFLVLRLDQAPYVDAHAIASTEPPSGIGEPATTPIAPAVANAIFALTGKRLRTLPFSDALAR